MKGPRPDNFDLARAVEVALGGKVVHYGTSGVKQDWYMGAMTPTYTVIAETACNASDSRPPMLTQVFDEVTCPACLKAVRVQ